MPGFIDSLKGTTDPVLTGIVQGYSNEAFVSNFLLPEISVTKNTGRYPIFGKDSLKINNSVRTRKSDQVQKINVDQVGWESFALVEHGLASVIDHEDEEYAADVYNLEEYSATAVMESLLLGKEYEAVQLLTTAANYASGHSSALSGTTCWNNSSSTPLTAISDAIMTIREDTLQWPNRFVLGLDSFIALANHASLTDRIKYTQTGVITTDLISALISPQDYKIEVKIGAGMYYDPIAEKMVDLWGDAAILAYVPGTRNNRRSMYERSFGFSFNKSGYPMASRKMGDHNLTKEVAAFAKYDQVIADNTAGYLWTNVKG